MINGLYEIFLAHKMLKERFSGLEYFQEFLKLLNPVSWKIFHMRNLDQKEWNRIKEAVDSEMSRREEDSEEYIEIDNIQKKNADSLKKIVSSVGCITVSKFGSIASHCAWLLVQHSDHDKEFQRMYLALMKKSAEDVSLENVKYLKMRLGLSREGA